VIAMVGADDEQVPPSTCPNCGNELHPDQSVCRNCGYIRPSSGTAVPASTGIKGGGGAWIGCGGAFVAIIICMVLYGVALPVYMPSASILWIEAVLAIGCFFAFRALISRNPHAREALIAFVIVFIIVGGGLASCVGMFNNFNVH
jgi:hypothetical protein